MDDALLTLRAGRTWRLNPTYREILARPREPLGEGSALPGAGEILDVLAIHVDGINVTADVRESCLFRLVGDLARAADRLVQGAPKAAVSFGTPAAELLLVRQQNQIGVTLVLPGPPPEIRIQDLEVDAGAFFETVRTCIEAFLVDLRDIAPELAFGPYGTTLLAKARHLRARRDRSPEPRAAPDEASAPRVAAGRPVPGGATACGFELFDDADRLGTCSPDPDGDLHSLLAPGRVQLHAPGGRTVAAWEGPPFLAFRSVVAELGDVLSALQTGEGQATIHLGEDVVVLDRVSGEVAGPNGRSAARPLQVISAILRATLDLCAAIVSRAPAQKSNPYLRDLATEAAELHAHCRELDAGDLTSAPAEPGAGAHPTPPRTVSNRPLAPWPVRKVSLRPRWTFDAGPLLPGGLALFGRCLLAIGEDGAFALDLDDGRTRWKREVMVGAWTGPRRGDPVLLASRLGLDLVTPTGATAWSHPPIQDTRSFGDPYVRGAGALLLCPDGRSVQAFRECDGTTAWRFVPPGARQSRLGGSDGGALLATDAGFLYALDVTTGRVRWRARTRIAPLAPVCCLGGLAYLVGTGDEGPALFRVDASTGSEPSLHPLPLDEAGPPSMTGGRLVIPGRVADAPALVIVAPGQGERRTVLEGGGGLPTVLAHRNRIYGADRSGRVAAFGGRGRLLWERRVTAAPGPGLPAPVLSASRGMLVMAYDGLHVLDPDGGEPLGSLQIEGALGTGHLLTDDRLDLYLADPDGTVQACRLGTFLSVVDGRD